MHAVVDYNLAMNGYKLNSAHVHPSHNDWQL